MDDTKKNAQSRMSDGVKEPSGSHFGGSKLLREAAEFHVCCRLVFDWR